MFQGRRKRKEGKDDQENREEDMEQEKELGAMRRKNL